MLEQSAGPATFQFRSWWLTEELRLIAKPVRKLRRSSRPGLVFDELRERRTRRSRSKTQGHEAGIEGPAAALGRLFANNTKKSRPTVLPIVANIVVVPKKKPARGRAS